MRADLRRIFPTHLPFSTWSWRQSRRLAMCRDRISGSRSTWRHPNCTTSRMAHIISAARQSWSAGRLRQTMWRAHAMRRGTCRAVWMTIMWSDALRRRWSSTMSGWLSAIRSYRSRMVWRRTTGTAGQNSPDASVTRYSSWGMICSSPTQSALTPVSRRGWQTRSS